MRSGMGLRCVQLKEVTASSTVSCSGYWCLWASCGPGENVENANLLAFFCDRNDLSHALVITFDVMALSIPTADLF